MDNIVQPLLGDTHEVTFQVELQNIGVARIVVRAAAYMVLDASDPLARTFAFATGVAVEDHTRLEERRQVVEQQMVHDSVPELRSENFSFTGLFTMNIRPATVRISGPGSARTNATRLCSRSISKAICCLVLRLFLRAS